MNSKPVPVSCDLCRDHAEEGTIVDLQPERRIARVMVGESLVELALDLVPDARAGERVLVQGGFVLARAAAP